MAFDPDNPRHLQRLRNAIEAAVRKIKDDRERRTENLRQYVGAHYGEEGSETKVPIGLLRMMVGILLPQLATHDPRALVLPENRLRRLSTTAEDFGLELNKLIKQQKLGKTLRAATLNALIGPMGIVKTGQTEVSSMMSADGPLSEMAPYAKEADIDDYVFDVSARTIEEVQFVGHVMRLPLERARNDPMFDAQGRANLQASDAGDHPNEWDTDKAEQLSHGDLTREDTYGRFTDIWCLYIPPERMTLMIPCDPSTEGQFERPLYASDYDGPEDGPFDYLGFFDVPKNVMPLSMAGAMLDLHDSVNILFNKLIRQGQRQKQIGLTRKTDKDADLIKRAADGEIYAVEDPNSVVERRFGGIDQSNFAFALALRQQFSKDAGNLELLGGLSPQADTLGQDRMLNANASEIIADMQDRVTDFARSIIKKLGWYRWHDPIHRETVVKTYGTQTVGLEKELGPEHHQGPYYELDVRVDPYSLRRKSPNERLQTLMSMWQMVLMPSLQQITAQGGIIDFKCFFQLIQEYGDLPELGRLITWVGADRVNPMGAERSLQSPVTTRVNERVNRSGMSPRGAEDMLIQKMMAQGGEPGVNR